MVPVYFSSDIGNMATHTDGLVGHCLPHPVPERVREAVHRLGESALAHGEGRTHD